MQNLNVKIARNAQVSLYPFKAFFQGFENIQAVKRIFGEKTDHVLSSLKVEFSGRRGYMGVNNADGHLMISANYLNDGDFLDIYLDIIHELVHVKQFMDGKELFDNHYTYVERPTEIEAYRHSVEEARRLGLDDERICQYLKAEWISDDELIKLAGALGVNCDGYCS